MISTEEAEASATAQAVAAAEAAEMAARVKVQGGSPVTSDSAPETAPVTAPAPALAPAPAPASAKTPVASDRVHIIAELRRRGINVPGASDTRGINTDPATAGIRPLERAVKVKQLAGTLEAQSLVNELHKRGIRTKFRLQPTEEEIQAELAQRGNAARTTIGLASDDPDVRARTINDQRNRMLEGAFSQTVGALPEAFEEPAGISPKKYEDFFHEKFAEEINQQQGNAPLGSKEDNQLRAQKYNELFTSPESQKAYEEYKTETASRTVPVKRGTPEYYSTLEKTLRRRMSEDQYQAALAKAVPQVLEAQAKAIAERPAQMAKTSEGIRKEIQDNKVLSKGRMQLAAVNQIRALTSKPNPTNQDDLALIYSMVRALDPESAVREGEITLLQKGIGLPNYLVTQFNRLTGDTNAVLTPDVRANIRGVAESQEKTAIQSSIPELRRYYEVAKSQGAPVTEIFTGPELDALVSTAMNPSASAAPAAGSPTAIPREQADAAPVVQNPALAPPNAPYIKSPDGRTFVNPNFRR